MSAGNERSGVAPVVHAEATVQGNEPVIDLSDVVAPQNGIPGVAIEPVVASGGVEVDPSPEVSDAEDAQRILDALDLAADEPTGIEDLAGGIGKPDEAADDDSDSVRLMAERGYAKDAPRFVDILGDQSRTTKFSYTRWNGKRGEMTEHEGLVQLDEFFAKVSEVVASIPEEQRMHLRPSLVELAETQIPSLRDDLTFIGSREYDEAVAGIGLHWKALLDSDPDLQICVVANTGDLPRYQHRAHRKSDDKIREDVLATFAPEQLAEYGGRIVGAVDDITQVPENVRIILIDDWMISGDQMGDRYQQLLDSDPGIVREVQELGGVEVHLLTAGEERIRNGVVIDDFRPAEGALPVVTYFRSHTAPRAKRLSGGHVSGLHSSVNWDFSKTIDGLINFAKSLGVETGSIALSDIERSYRRDPVRLEMTPHGVKPVASERKAEALV